MNRETGIRVNNLNYIERGCAKNRACIGENFVLVLGYQVIIMKGVMMDTNNIEPDSANYITEVTVTRGKPTSAIKERRAQTGVRIATILGATMLFLNGCAPVKSVLDASKEELTKVNVENTEDISTSTPTHTPTPTELPTATPTLAPTETKEPTPTEVSKCVERLTFDPWEVSVDIEGYGEHKTNGGWGSRLYLIDIPGSTPGLGPETSLDSLRYNKGDFTFKIPVDSSIHSVDPNLKIFVNGEEWSISSGRNLHLGEKVFIEEGSIVKVHSDGNLSPSSGFLDIVFKPSDNINLNESFMVGEQAFPILCDENSGHYYVNAQGTSKTMVITSNYSGYFTNTENIYSFSRNGYFTYGEDLVGYLVDPDNPVTVTFKNTENMDFTITFGK